MQREQRSLTWDRAKQQQQQFPDVPSTHCPLLKFRTVSTDARTPVVTSQESLNKNALHLTSDLHSSIFLCLATRRIYHGAAL